MGRHPVTPPPLSPSVSRNHSHFFLFRRYVTTRAQSQIHASFASMSAQRRASQRSVSQRDVDEDWRRCVQRYPEVLEGYYRQVEDAVRSGRGVAEIMGGGGGGHGGGRMRVVYE